MGYPHLPTEIGPLTKPSKKIESIILDNKLKWMCTQASMRACLDQVLGDMFLGKLSIDK